MHFRFSVDDNILFLKDIKEKNYTSIFDNSYLALYKRLHEKFDLKVQLNLFFEYKQFNLTEMPNKYKSEWQSNKDWLQLSFHSKNEQTVYTHSDYNTAYNDCQQVHNEIIRFAGQGVLNPFTTIHCCTTTHQANSAFYDSNIKGLAGLFGTIEKPRESYNLKFQDFKSIYKDCFYYDKASDLYFVNIDMVINTFDINDIMPYLSKHIGRQHIEIMIHEQYFYPDYYMYQPDYEQKLNTAISYLIDNDYKSCFLDEFIKI